MRETLISVKHHVDDYECMWNGIEDLYLTKSGETIPDFFFFSLSGIGNFVSYKTPQSEVKRHAVWSDGRTKKMYERLAPVVGFRYKHTEGTRFAYMLNQAKRNIDAGDPVVLGCLDMYCLRYYPKFWHKEHVPIHYVLMVGYSDEKQCVFLHDCGLAGVQELSYPDLEEALNIEKTGLSGKNAMCEVHFGDRLPDVLEIAEKAFADKAQSMLNPPVGFLGIKGMRQLAGEFAGWKDELSEEDYRAALREIVTFTGTVPLPPDALLPPDEKSGLPHKAQREKLANVLFDLSGRYGIPEWKNSAEEFEKSGELLSHMTDRMTEYLLGNCGGLDDIPSLINETADIEEHAFLDMLKGSQKG
ncbi:MAG TPA: BtrH N-terminal domain-containing protein [Oscillospiraceae bacterium]|nr:BtrH N-terminal domain-containing protein [Oscillospiraceae bacterium]